jgi:hypothetical protein
MPIVFTGAVVAQPPAKPVSTPTVLTVEMKKKIDAAMPKALPQASAVKKERSDAEDERLKGKVKSVVEESVDLTDGPWSKYGRHFTQITEYDTRGDRTKEIWFEGSGRPTEVNVYGYIDGFRVYNSGYIRYDNNRYTLLGPEKPPPVPPHAPDPRFENQLLYKYKGGRLAEMQIMYNDGLKGMRYVYNRNGNILEWIAYTDDDEPNQKYHYILDDKGNEIEWISFEVRPGMPARPEDRYPIKNEAFDKAGNWTERTRYKFVMENGKKVEKPLYKEYRTITYYP